MISLLFFMANRKQIIKVSQLHDCNVFINVRIYVCWKRICLDAQLFSLKIHINPKSVYSDVMNYKWMKLHCCQIDSWSCCAASVGDIDFHLCRVSSLGDLSFTQMTFLPCQSSRGFWQLDFEMVIKGKENKRTGRQDIWKGRKSSTYSL